jgi:hypothetical protein
LSPGGLSLIHRNNGYFTGSIALGLHCFVKKGSRGL